MKSKNSKKLVRIFEQVKEIYKLLPNLDKDNVDLTIPNHLKEIVKKLKILLKKSASKLKGKQLD